MDYFAGVDIGQGHEVCIVDETGKIVASDGRAG
jgi:hypothetical protein